MSTVIWIDACQMYFYVPTPRTTKTGPFGAGPCTLAGTFGGVIV